MTRLTVRIISHKNIAIFGVNIKGARVEAVTDQRSLEEVRVGHAVTGLQRKTTLALTPDNVGKVRTTLT